MVCHSVVFNNEDISSRHSKIDEPVPKLLFVIHEFLEGDNHDGVRTFQRKEEEGLFVIVLI